MDKTEIVKLKNVGVDYNGTPVLENVNLTVEFGDFLAIIGPNGGGKSTLLKVILGLIIPDRGTATVLGRPADRNHSGIGYVPQYAFFDREFPITVREVVLTARYHKKWFPGRYNSEDKKIAEEVLQTTEMTEYADRQIGQLSGGQQQRVFIARALATGPELLLLDEPTASIDPDMKAEFYKLLARLKKEMSIILVSHDISAVSIYVDMIACLNRRLIYHGSKKITPETLEETYGCPVQLIAHGDVPHRVLKEHDKGT
jgi:zinc transport system ATP-binding protein